MKNPTKKNTTDPLMKRHHLQTLAKEYALCKNIDEMDKKQRTVTKIQDDLPSCHKIFFHLLINLKLLTKRDRKLQPYKP